MTTYKTESHIRSLIKSITWRFVATIDTILVVLSVTCLSGNCSIESAIKIGFIELIAKFVIYYMHERFWQQLLKNKSVTKIKTFQKTISWRIIATIMTFVVSGSVLNSFGKIALYIAIIELFTKFTLYYFHERLWLKIPLDRIK